MQWVEQAAAGRTARGGSRGAGLPGGTTMVPGLCGRKFQGGDSGQWARSRGHRQGRSVRTGTPSEKMTELNGKSGLPTWLEARLKPTSFWPARVPGVKVSPYLPLLPCPPHGSRLGRPCRKQAAPLE